MPYLTLYIVTMCHGSSIAFVVANHSGNAKHYPVCEVVPLRRKQLACLREATSPYIATSWDHLIFANANQRLCKEWLGCCRTSLTYYNQRWRFSPLVRIRPISWDVAKRNQDLLSARSTRRISRTANRCHWIITCMHLNEFIINLVRNDDTESLIQRMSRIFINSWLRNATAQNLES